MFNKISFKKKKIAWFSILGVCSEPTNSPKLLQPSPTQPTKLGKFLRVRGLGLELFFFTVGRVGFGS